MCRLFGFRSSVPSGAHRSLIEAENALALQSRAHPDGWGIGWFVDEDAYVVKAASAAHTCERFRRASSRLQSQAMIVHVRRATVGVIDHLNAHPFRFGRWLFAHNGTLFGFEELRPWMLEHIDEGFRPMLLGDTDSEHLFFYLLSALADNGGSRSGRLPSDASMVAQVTRAALAALDAEACSRGLLRPIVNLLLTDGRCFVAHRAGMPLHMSTQKRRCPDAATCPAASRVCLEPERDPAQPVNHLLVASEPIGADNLWEPVADGVTLELDERFRLRVHAAPEGWEAPYLPEHLKAPPIAAP